MLSLRTFFRTKRALRTACDIAVLLFDGSDSPTPAILVNASDTGVRLECANDETLVAATTFLIVEKAQAYALRLVWRQGDQAGFRIMQSSNVRGYVDPAFKAAKNAWEQAVVLQPSLSPRRFFGSRSAR